MVITVVMHSGCAVSLTRSIEVETQANMDERDALLAAARTAQQHAYAPYSRFAVGSALLTTSGAIVCGANVENASYGLSLCAERVALARAVQEGHGPATIVAIAIVSDADTPTYPCGACRQWLIELAPRARVYCAANGTMSVAVTTVSDLMPFPFSPADLGIAAS